MLFDTDVLIWLMRGNDKAAKLVDGTEDRRISVITYMELLQGARNKQEIKTIKSFLSDFSFLMLPLSENIGHRAMIYVEMHGLKVGMYIADALIAATAVENGLALLTANQRHYRAIPDLDMKVFRP